MSSAANRFPPSVLLAVLRARQRAAVAPPPEIRVQIDVDKLAEALSKTSINVRHGVTPMPG